MTSAAPRGILSGLLDKFVGRRLSLPPELCSYTIQRLNIPLEKEIKLTADLYQPTNFTPLGTILVLSPYGIGFPGSLTNARVFAARGYQVLISCCRGTFESNGEFEPGRNEAADGHAVVAWMKKQSWYTGSFATLGGSYLGYNQWALLSCPPDDMKTAVIWTGPHDFGDFIWGTGALSSNMIAWADIQRRMRGGSLISMIWYLRSQRIVLKPVYDSVPLLHGVDKFFKGEMPNWLRETMTRSDLNDEYYIAMNQSSGIENGRMPIFLSAGWDDLILPNVMSQYERLSERSCDVALTVGPWTHLGAQAQNTALESFNWLNEHLGCTKSGARPSPVRIFVTGAQEWRDLAKWPPPTSNLKFYLDGGKKLSPKHPTDGVQVSVFEFDPADPTPSVGTPLLFDNGPGRTENNNILGSRSDVLIFDSEVLGEDIEVCGKPVVKLYHSTDRPDADLWVLLSDVNVKGDYSRSISEKYLRLPQVCPSNSIIMTLTDCAHRFRKGNKIRLLVAGACHPRYIRNLGTGEDPVRGVNVQTVRHTVRHEASTISKVILPTTTII